MNRRCVTAIAGALALTGATAGQASEAPVSRPTSRPAIARERRLGVMGTDLHIRVEGEDAGVLDAAIEAAVAELRRVEDLMTDWRASPLTQMNASAGGGPQKLPVELAAIIARSLEISKLTRGAFDPTYAAVGQLWSFNSRQPSLPRPEAIEKALSHVGAARVTVDVERCTVDLPAGMVIGLGGIAKGYGVDRAMRVLLKHEIRHAIVNAGGDLKVLGHSGGDPWEVAIKHPRDRERALAVLRVSNTAVVTSGDYERFFEIDGKRYHHIIDPRTGYPSTGCISATVVAPSAELADAIATALCVLGPQEGIALVETLDRVEAIVVGLDGKVAATPRLRGSLRR